MSSDPIKERLESFLNIKWRKLPGEGSFQYNSRGLDPFGITFNDNKKTFSIYLTKQSPWSSKVQGMVPFHRSPSALYQGFLFRTTQVASTEEAIDIFKGFISAVSNIESFYTENSSWDLLRDSLFKLRVSLDNDDPLMKEYLDSHIKEISPIFREIGFNYFSEDYCSLCQGEKFFKTIVEEGPVPGQETENWKAAMLTPCQQCTVGEEDVQFQHTWLVRPSLSPWCSTGGGHPSMQMAEKLPKIRGVTSNIELIINRPNEYRFVPKLEGRDED